MKKVIGVAAFAVLGMVALSSCKKDYTCNCVDGYDGTNWENGSNARLFEMFYQY